MPASELKPLVIADLRGGRNDADPPLALRPDQAVELLNVHWKDTPFAAKRGGSAAVTDTGGTAFSVGLQTILRHVPGADETAAEFWGIDGAATPIVKRMVGGTSWADVALDDAIASRPADVVGATLNGKLFLAYDSSVDRLHVYDPNLASARVRRVGFATPGAPTVANQGSGSLAATLRYYRVRWLHVVGTLVLRRSEAGASVAFTPSGSGEFARITQPTVAGEGETHWEIDVSLDNTTWFQWYALDYQSSHIAIATTFIDTAGTSATFITSPAAYAAGTYSRFPSVKYLITDGNRLLGAGAWESAGADSGGKSSRVWFTPVLGSSDKGDDERVPAQTNQKNWVDLNERDGGGNTALGVVNGVPFAFKARQVWKLTPTGDVAVPYLPRKLRDDIGCISHKSIAVGEDEGGRPALYFMSHRGPYRIVLVGGALVIQYLGRDNEVTWRSMNLAATGVVTHSIYYPDLHQWWVWASMSAENDPVVKMVFDVQLGFPDEHGQIRGGWAKHTGQGARCSCLMSNTLAASMSRDLKPYIGRHTGTAVWKTDTADLDDAGTDFQARVKSRPILTHGDLGHKYALASPYLLAKILTGVTVTLTSDRDFGAETRTHTALLTASGTETRALKKFEGGELGEADVIQLEVGDGSAQEGAWTFDALVIPVTRHEWK